MEEVINRFLSKFKLLLFLLPAVPAIMHAETISVDINRLRYTVNTESGEAEIEGPVSSTSSFYNLAIPDYINHEGKQYPVTSIKDRAFLNMTYYLSGSLTIGNFVKTIGDHAFYNCKKLTGALTIPNSVTSIGDHAFYYCEGFKGNLTIPNSVTSIGESAFYYCNGFNGNLTIPNSVTSIGKNAFNSCEGFTGNLTIPNSVTSIGEYAFAFCKGLTGELNISNSITTIRDHVFAGCTGLTGPLTIPNSVTSIEERAFFCCSGFTGSLTIPNSVTSIGNDAFYLCTNLTGSLTIPNSVTSIGNSAFHSCSRLTGSLTIPNSVTSIGESAFYYCKGFTGSLIIPESVTTINNSTFELCSGFNGELILGNSVSTIGEKAFSNCTGLTGSLIIPNSVIDIQDYAFDKCSGFNGNLTLGNSVQTIGSCAFRQCGNFNGSLTIPNSVSTIGSYAFSFCSGFNGPLSIGNSVTSIGTSAFHYCDGLTGPLTIPSSVVSLGEGAFESCSGFNGSLSIPSSISIIEKRTFKGCSKITGELIIPTSVTEIKENAFYDCSSFTGSLKIPSSVTTIEKSAFEGCSGFNGNLFIPSTISEINDNTFKGCSGLTGSLSIPNTIKSIGSSAFEDCSGFTESLTIPNSVMSIGHSAFKDCNGFDGNLIIPSTIEVINYQTFEGCSGLSGSLSIPTSVKSINWSAFDGCSGFTGSLTIPNSVTSIGSGAFRDCSGFTGSLTIPSSISTIESSTFYGCSGLTGSLTIPNSVMSIGYSAFRDCSGFSGSLTIPSSISTIESSTFYGCSGLTGSLTIPSTVTTIGSSAFSNCNFSEVTSLAEQPAKASTYAFNGLYESPLYVPKESILRYKYANEWKNFKYLNPIYIAATDISLNKSELTLNVGDEETLIATLDPESSSEDVIWSVNEEFQKIISVNSTGKVTALAEGEAVVEATAGSVSASCKVTVKRVPTTGVSLNVHDMTLFVGASDKLTATVSPENATDKTITWGSDNEAIAKVSENGTVTAIAVGVANITASCGEISASCKVTVNPVVVSSITISAQDIALPIGATDKLIVTVSPENATDPIIEWKSDNEAIATVDENGNVTAVAVGVANITASCGEASATCKVTVNPVTASGITLNVPAITLLVGTSDKLTATLSPENVTDKTVTWSSDNTAIATVDAEGNVTAVAVGVANITATCGETSATCKVTVNPVTASGITINVPDMTLLVGATDKLTATVSPENVTDKTITWSSDNTAIATVDAEGKVTAVAVGVANITATCGEASATCKVTVNPVTASGITLNVPDMTLLVGASDKLTATVSPENVTDKTITWSSDNTAIATVDENGNVSAVAVGVANITVTCGEATATCKVTVNPVTASGITLNVPNMTLLVGTSDKLNATISPENVTDKTVTWSSDNTAIATIDENGNVTAVAVGVANITASCGSASATCKVTVNPVTASGITINVPDMTLLVGASDKLTATVSPENVTDKTVTWSSDNEAIATVDAEGNVTAVAVGVANITATCGSATATCKVTVNPVTASGITLNVPDMTLLVGASDKLTATVSPENVTDKTIIWTSDNEAIATVDAEGNVAALAVGVANITATCGEATATCKVTVNPVTASGITLNVPDMTLLVGASDNITATCGSASATCKVTVNPVTASGITLNVPDMTLLVGASDKLTATVSPENVTDKTVTWSSDNEAIATVDADGNVTAVAVGVANITATCGEATATCKVTVNPVTASGITLNVPDMTLLVGASDKLTATVSPENVTDKTIIWTSDNEAIATVDAEGNVTAVAVGVVNITATCGSASATCKVTVNPVTASSVSLNVPDMTLLVGASDKLTATVSPENVTDKTVTWSSDNEAIVTVDAEGNVTAVAVGVANITATCGETSATCKVTVESLAERPETPAQMLRKGNGQSCTFITMMALTDTELEQDGYSFVYGYTDALGIDNVIAKTNARYCHTSPAVFNNAGNDFWVFSVTVDEEGEMICSERRHLDGRVDDDYNPAEILGKSRGLDGTDPSNWIVATPRGVRITVESQEAVVITVCSLGGQVVMMQEAAPGSSVSEEITGDILAPNVYLVRVDCGNQNASKKVIIR